MKRTFWLWAVAMVSMLAVAQSATPSLEEQFRNPPDSAKPRAWWHWMSGNVTQPGITADLEWMHRVGIAGMQMFDDVPPESGSSGGGGISGAGFVD